MVLSFQLSCLLRPKKCPPDCDGLTVGTLLGKSLIGVEACFCQSGGDLVLGLRDSVGVLIVAGVFTAILELNLFCKNR
jgi:hypothetical protein